MSFADVRAALAATEQETAATLGRTQDDLAAALDRAVAAERARDAAVADLTAHMATHGPGQPPAPQRRLILGMSAPKGQWATRLAEVGAQGITARRIFADLTADGRDQAALIREAADAGMIPVVSYKAKPGSPFTVADVIAGRADAALAKVRAHLESYGVELTATFWHEPNGDMPAADFRAASKRFLDIVQGGNIKVGPLLNGFLLDRQVATFASFTDAELLRRWDFFGLDTYEAGTLAKPGVAKPADRIPKVVEWLASVGHAGKPIVVGEYNGYSGETIKACGDALLAEPTLWIACMWNSTEGKGYVLTDQRLAAFKATKAHPAVALRPSPAVAKTAADGDPHRP